MPGFIIVFIEFKHITMKNLRYILMGMLFFAILPFCNSQTQLKKEQVITIQSIPANASPELLSESKEILLRRMTFMSLRDVRITQKDARSELVVTTDDTLSRETLTDLLLIQGHLQFYCSSTPEDVLNEQDVLEAHADVDDQGHPTLSITFKEKVWKLLEETTRKNINKTMDFAIDKKVYSSPRISGEIKTGKISLTGSGFSREEVGKLAAIISCRPLPLKFSVVSN